MRVQPLEAILFDFSYTLFRPEEGSTWVRRAGERVGAALDDGEAVQIAGKIERLFLEPEHAERQVGRDLSAEAHRTAVGSVLESVEETIEGLGQALYERLIEPDAWAPYRDARPVLRALKRVGCRTGVVSNIGWDIRANFAHYGLTEFVDGFTLSFEHGLEKPDPALFEAACHALQASPRATIMVGDNPLADGGAVHAGLGVYLLPGAGSPGRAAMFGTDTASDSRGLARVLDLVSASYVTDEERPASG
jgi:HAD superfamily hydrolase (TIGR01509 family)